MSPEEIVDVQLAAFSARDLVGFLDCFVPEVEVLAFPSGEVLADRSGRAFADRFERVFEASPDLTVELVSRVVKDRIVIDQERITGFLGSAEVRESVALYEVGTSKIERMWFVS